MSNDARQRNDLVQVSELMRDALRVMQEFPEELPRVDLMLEASESETGKGETPDVKRWLHATSMEEVLSDGRIAARLESLMASWPREFMSIFIQFGSIIAEILEGFGGTRVGGFMDFLAAGSFDLDTLNLMSALAQLSRDEENTKDASAEDDPTGIKQVMMAELQRRNVVARTPFARTLTTLLGPDAILWLTANSQEGEGKIQPHEFARTGWPTLWAIENQLAIEQELLNIEPSAEYLGKIVVALSWTLASLANLVDPSVFLGEQTGHISSTRPGQYTVSYGVGTHTLIRFQPATMSSLVDILAVGLTNPLLSAADLMWIGAGLARIRDVNSGLGDPLPVTGEQFALFLSHRGRDAKRPLAERVQALPKSHGVFLDCLTMPNGVINRSFVFGSLVRSARILIVETENYHESAWCRKEAWLAEALASHKLAVTERVTLHQALEAVSTAGPNSDRRRSQKNLGYPISHRVLMDIDYWARVPNLHSLKEKGYSTDSLLPLQSALEQEANPDDATWVRSIGTAVLETLSNVVSVAPNAEPIDLWATALQYSLAAFSSTSNARSKVEVRREVDQLNAVLQSLVSSELKKDPTFLAQAPSYLALLAAAAAINLAGFELDPRMDPALCLTLNGVAGLRDGMLLLDVRQPGPTRTFRLRLVTLLMRGNMGSVGIVQDAADEVHRSRIDGLPLEVLSCVTLYPGMEVPFAPAQASPESGFCQSQATVVQVLHAERESPLKKIARFLLRRRT